MFKLSFQNEFIYVVADNILYDVRLNIESLINCGCVFERTRYKYNE